MSSSTQLHVHALKPKLTCMVFFFFFTFIFLSGLDLSSCAHFAIWMVNARKLSQYLTMPVINAGTSTKNKVPNKKRAMRVHSFILAFMTHSEQGKSSSLCGMTAVTRPRVPEKKFENPGLISKHILTSV